MSCSRVNFTVPLPCASIIFVMFIASIQYFNVKSFCSFNDLFVPDTTLLTSILCPLAETIITRECLSSLRAVRTDIPADHYEGCRPAAKDVRLAHYVNNSIKELDIKRYAFTTAPLRLS